MWTSVQKYLRTSNNTLKPNDLLCENCNRKSGLITNDMATTKYGLTDVDLNQVGFSRPPRRLQRKKKVRKFYCETEVRLLAILKWGNLSAIRRRRASWQTTLDEASDSDRRKAVKLLQNLKLFAKQKLD